MADVITCPSGLTGRVRGMNVREERVLADRNLAKNGGQIDELAACWGGEIDAGPYVLAEGAKLDLGKVLQGDRFCALLMVRLRTMYMLYITGSGALKVRRRLGAAKTKYRSLINSTPRSRNSQERAAEWSRRLASGEVLSRADLARAEGVSRAYVTQVLRPVRARRGPPG